MGMNTQSFSEFQVWARAAAARHVLEDGVQKELQARQAALNRQALALEQLRADLDERDLEVEKRLDRLAEVNSALSLALLEAKRWRVRSDRLSSQIRSMRHHECALDLAPTSAGALPVT